MPERKNKNRSLIGLISKVPNAEVAMSMLSVVVVVGALVLTTLLPLLSAPREAASASANITIDPNTTYQTMTGWEATDYAGQDNPAYANFRGSLYDKVVNDLGINRIRLEIRSGVENTRDYWTDYQQGRIDRTTWRCVRYSTVNDNADAGGINWAGFHFSDFDEKVETIVLPLKQLLEARGEKLYINLTYVAFTAQMRASECPAGLTYVHNQPNEYAEFILAASLHLRNKYGLSPDAWEVILEPDNVSEWRSGTTIGNAINATATKLEANGFSPRFNVPATTNMSNAPVYFDAIAQVLGSQKIGRYIEEIAYHRYTGVSDTSLQGIANRGVQHGVNTSMLEWWSNANGYQTLHNDLKMGRNSTWQQGTILGIYDVDTTNPNNPVIQIPEMTKFTRQYFKFIRAGAVRIGANSQDANFDPLAFVNSDGKYVVVVKAGSGGSFSIQGLSAGTYGLKYTTATQYDVDLPDVSVSSGAAVNATIPAAGVITVYAKSLSPSGEPMPMPISTPKATPTNGSMPTAPFSVNLSPVLK